MSRRHFKFPLLPISYAICLADILKHLVTLNDETSASCVNNGSGQVNQLQRGRSFDIELSG